MITGWRISSSVFSNKEDMISGEGAFLYGGRWNSPGGRVIYLGSSIAQAAMELLVHLGRADVLKTYCKMPISFKESFLEQVDINDLPEDWMDNSLTPPTQAIGDSWLRRKESVVLKVPSVAVNGEFNYLINVEHPDFSRLAFGEVETFSYDQRLFIKGDENHQPIQRRSRTISNSKNQDANDFGIPKKYAKLASIPSVSGIGAEAVDIICSRIGKESLDIESIAKELGHSRRTLQRLLKAEMVSYAALRDKVRFHYSIRFLLRDKKSLEEIASALDFNSTDSFKNAFKRWAKITPQQFLELYS